VEASQGNQNEKEKKRGSPKGKGAPAGGVRRHGTGTKRHRRLLKYSRLVTHWKGTEPDKYEINGRYSTGDKFPIQ